MTQDIRWQQRFENYERALALLKEPFGGDVGKLSALEGVERGLRSARIAAELEELPIVAKFDVQALADITHAPLLEHIERVGVRIHERTDGTR